MADDRVRRILDAAYACFVRHGVRRTTMDDIAAAAGMSRPAVYQYVRNKDDAFRRLAGLLFDGALERARTAATGPAPIAERLHDVLAVKLELVLRLWHDTPAHAAELLDASARLSAEVTAFTGAMRAVVVELVTGAVARGELTLRPEEATEFADIAIALVRGLEAEPTDPEPQRRRLRRAISLLLAGITP